MTPITKKYFFSNKQKLGAWAAREPITVECIEIDALLCGANFAMRRFPMPVVPQITIYVVLVWLLWGFFMAIGWVLGTWIMNQILGNVLRADRPARTP